MKTATNIIPVLLGIGMMLLSSCQFKKHENHNAVQTVSNVTYDTTSDIEEEILDNRSDVQFCKALKLLKIHRNLEASLYIQQAVNSLKKEGTVDTGELKDKLNAVISELLQIAAAAKKGSVDINNFARKYHSAEWIVAQYEVEEWEQMPVLEMKTSIYLQKTLQDIGYKLISEDKNVKKEGERLLKESYALLQSSNTLNKDKLVLATHTEAEKMKSFIKRQI